MTSVRELTTEEPPDGKRTPGRPSGDGGVIYGDCLVDESEILSPGPSGSVFNPIVWAEFRRWRARPWTYLGIVLLMLAGICVVYYTKGNILAKLAGVNLVPQSWTAANNVFVMYFNTMVRLILRPSTILPLLMVWRALVTFRDDGMYRPFRTTFLTPGDFLWGVIAVPFLLSAIILVGYTGAVLSPRMIESYYQMNPEYRGLHPFWMVLSILFEGSLNGAVICLIALYFGVKLNARLSALFPVAVAILLIQTGHSFLYLGHANLSRWFIAPASEWLKLVGRLPEAWHDFLIWFDPAGVRELDQKLANGTRHIRSIWTYYAAGIPKLIVCIVLWRMTKRLLRRTED